jgi:F-type H+-transporting ATPase subunit delta
MAELVARRYGQALFELAIESERAEEIEKEIRYVLDSLKHEKEFFEVLNHPKLSEDDKVALIENIFSSHVGREVMGFLVLTIRKGRHEHILDMLEYTLAPFDERSGYIKAVVTSAVALDQVTKDSIMKRLEKQTGKKITLISKVDKSVLGGLHIRIKDRIVDNTIKESLHRMSRDIYEAKV